MGTLLAGTDLRPSPWDGVDSVHLKAGLPQLNLPGRSFLSIGVGLPDDSTYSQVDTEDQTPYPVLYFTDPQRGPSLFCNFLMHTMKVHATFA